MKVVSLLQANRLIPTIRLNTELCGFSLFFDFELMNCTVCNESMNLMS